MRFGESEFSLQNGGKFVLASICYFNFFMPPYGITLCALKDT